MRSLKVSRSQGLKLILWIAVLIGIAGCVGLKEGMRGIAGTSTKILEVYKKDGVSKTFAMDYAACEKKTREILGKIGSYIYAVDKEQKLIAFYVSSQDTTPVGLFFKIVDASNTEILVSSPSRYAKELIADKVFSELEKALKK